MGYQPFIIHPRDLVLVEPRQGQGCDVFRVQIVTAMHLKDVIKSPRLFEEIHRQLRAGDKVELFRFTDPEKARLVET